MYMPSKDKKRKKKSKKPRMTTEEVLKLLKKLRPKTQQTVRVNVGTGDGKSKKDLSSYTPPFVYPGFQQAVVAPAPAQPAQPTQAAALPMSQQTHLQPWIIPSTPSIPPPPPLQRSASYITDAESGAEIPVKVRKSRKKAEEAQQGYSVSAPRTFTAPRTTRTSQLAAYAAEPLRFNEPVVNDPFLPLAPAKEQAADQMGNEPAALPSDEWTGTPSGEEQPLADIVAAAAPTAEEAVEPTASSTVERLRTIPEIAQAFQEEEPFGEASTPITSPAQQSKPERLYEFDYMQNIIRDAPQTAIGLMRNEIIQSKYAGVPEKFLTKSGRLKSKLSAQELSRIYFG